MLDQADTVKRVLQANVYKQSRPVKEPKKPGQTMERVESRDVRGGQWNLARRVTGKEL